jgi:beta-hydroxylase
VFVDPEAFPFTHSLEQNWREIRAEFEGLPMDSFVPWPERELYGRGWDVAGLYAFGRKLAECCARCPQTTRLVEAVPGLSTAGFSRLHPGTHIRPHCGYTPAVLRCHLGLVVPAGCSMRVGAETREWCEGRCLVFDDTTEHEVWHRGKLPRVVLLVDFARPGADGADNVAMPDAVAAVLDTEESAAD